MTKLLYLEDTYMHTSTAHVNTITTLPDGRTAIIIDQTIFYPQGGGQPCDTGVIENDQARFIVTDVRLDKDGTVFHMGTFEHGALAPNQIVKLSIDAKRRIQNSKIHSAGHLLDCAITQLNFALKPSKGYHFPEGPYVEYEGEIPNTPETIQAIQEKIDQLIKNNIFIKAYQLSYEQAQQQGIVSPEGKEAHIVQFGEFEPCGCGGTHIKSANDIGAIDIRKIKIKNGITRISYEIRD